MAVKWITSLALVALLPLAGCTGGHGSASGVLPSGGPTLPGSASVPATAVTSGQRQSVTPASSAATPDGAVSDCVVRAGTQPPAGSDLENDLHGVAVLSRSNAWAVGSSATRIAPNGGEQAAQTLIEHWDGHAWKRVPSPNPAGPDDINYLYGVAATSATDAWAVGEYSRVHHPLILHWNGTAWTQMTSPGGADDALSAVSATSTSDAWAVGATRVEGTRGAQTLIVHWNGVSWSQVPSPNPGLRRDGLASVSATSADDAWAVGSYSDSTAQDGSGGKTLIEHWDGNIWTHVPSPNPATKFGSGFKEFGSGLTAVSATSDTDAWAVGDYQTDDIGTSGLSLTEHWDGTVWRIVPSPNLAGNFSVSSVYLNGVADISTRNAWAVGFMDTPVRSVLENWNGKAWRRVPSPDPRSSSALFAVTASSANNLWAVGDDADFRPLALNCS